MFKFYVMLVGPDMIIDAAWPPGAGALSKPHDYKQQFKKRRKFGKHGFEVENSLKL